MFTHREASEKIDSFRGAREKERERGRVVSGGSRVNIFRRTQPEDVIMGRAQGRLLRK